MRKRDNKPSNSQNKNNESAEPAIKKFLKNEKISRKGYVDWRVTTQEDIEYVFTHYYTEISVYRVRTRRFDKGLCKKHEILRTINEKSKNGYKNLFRPLKKSEKDILDSYNVPYKPYKLRIFLQRIKRII